MTVTDLPMRPIRASPFCGGSTRGAGNEGNTCRRPAGWGTPHPGWGRCKLHGGSTPTGVRAVAIEQARQVAQLYSAPRTVHPLDGLLEEYYRTAGLVDSYEAMCAGLTPREVVWGTQSVEDNGSAEGEGDGGGEESLTPPKVKRGASINLWVKLYNDERDRFASLGERIIKLDLESRKVEYTQNQVAALVAVLLSADLALSSDQRRVAARLLREMDDRKAIEGSVV